MFLEIEDFYYFHLTLYKEKIFFLIPADVEICLSF